jgi:hypothetical protein
MILCRLSPSPLSFHTFNWQLPLFQMCLFERLFGDGEFCAVLTRGSSNVGLRWLQLACAFTTFVLIRSCSFITSARGLSSPKLSRVAGLSLRTLMRTELPSTARRQKPEGKLMRLAPQPPSQMIAHRLGSASLKRWLLHV